MLYVKQAFAFVCSVFKQTWDQLALKVAREAAEIDIQLAEIFMVN